MLEAKFCTECGSDLVVTVINSWDRYTGERKKAGHCSNTKCEAGCAFYGHVWGKFWKFQNWEKCQRCGYQICDY